MFLSLIIINSKAPHYFFSSELHITIFSSKETINTNEIITKITS